MGTTSQKLTYLSDTKTKIRDRINAIGGSLDSDDTFRSYADELESLYNDMPKVSESDVESASLSPTRKGAMSITYKGQTQQDSTTGKNLFDINGTLYSGSINKVNNGFKLIKDDTYRTLSMILTTPIPAGTYKCTYNVINSTLSDVNKVTITIRTDSSELANFKVNTNGENTFTINDTATRIYAYISTAEATDTYITLDNFMISVNGGDYEPYTNGASPNPDYPQEIHNVSGDNTIEICGKNLLNITTTLIADRTNNGIKTQVNDNQTITISGTASSTARYFTSDDNNKMFLKAGTYTISSNSTMPVRLSTKTVSGTTQLVADTFTINEDFYIYNGRFNLTNGTTYNETVWIQLEKNNEATTYEAYTGQSQLISLGVENLFDKDGTLTSGYLESTGSVVSSTNWKYTDYIPIQPKTAYTTSGMENGAGGDPSRCYYDKNKNFISGTKHLNQNPFVNTSPSNAYYMIESVRVADLDTIQIEKGSKKNSYSPYGKPYIELNKISTYQDYIYKDNDKWFLHKEIGKVVLDGSENWSYNSQYTFFYTTSFTPVNTDVYTNYYKYYSTITGITGNYGCSVYNNNFRIKNTDYSVPSDFKNWLSTHNTIVYYVLATPTDTEITDTTLLSQLETIKRSYDGVTNISQENNDLAFILDVSALKEWNNE